MKRTYFKTCPHCGARLDPGEKCDCRKAKAEARPYRNGGSHVKADDTEKAS